MASVQKFPPGIRHTCSQTSPPRLCATKKTGRSSASILSYVNAFAKLLPWSRSVFEEATSMALTTSASYPNVMIRAEGKLAGSRLWGQNMPLFSSVHVDSRLPVNPWMKTILMDLLASAFEFRNGWIIK
jgi:hypothetical protein